MALARENSKPAPPRCPVDIAAIFDNLSDSKLLARLWQYRTNSRPGYPLRSMWLAYVASIIENMGSTNDLIRRLKTDGSFRTLCGFEGRLPHRTTFNRFISRLSYHPDLVEEACAGTAERLKALRPDLGDEVAIDSTTVRSHASPNRKHLSDPEASWTKKNSTRGRDGKKVSFYGFKMHAVADVNYGIPLSLKVTTASRNDMLELPEVMEQARTTFKWFRPRYAMADKGYDSMANNQYLFDNGTTPVILMRKAPNSELYGGIYTDKGVPTCLGMVPMAYVRSDPEKGHLYRCRAGGCRLAASKGVKHCKDEVWEDPRANLRWFGAPDLRRDSEEWKALYVKRQNIESTFKSMKQSLRLERHCVRGLRQIRLHCLMVTLVYQARALASIKAGAQEQMRWMVERVA